METFGKITVIILISILVAIIHGFVISTLWGWFVVPIFELQPLRVIEAIGLMLIIQYIRIKKPKNMDDDEIGEEIVGKIFFMVLTTIVALTSGYIVSFLI